MSGLNQLDPPRAIMTGMVGAMTLGGSLLAFSHGGYYIGSWGLLSMGLLLLAASLVAFGIVPAVRLGRIGMVGVAAIVAAAVWTAASVAWAANTQTAWEEAARTGLYAVAALLAATLVRRAGDVSTMLTVGALVPAVAAVLVLLQPPSELAAGFDDARLLGQVGYHNGYAAFLLAPFWSALAIAAARGTRWWHAVPLGAGTVVTLQVALLTQSRGSVILLVIGGLVTLALTPRRLRTLALACPAVAAAAANWDRLGRVYADHQGQDVPPSAVDGLAGVVLPWAIVGAAAAVVLVVGDHYVTLPRRAARWMRRSGAAFVSVAVVVAAVASYVAVDGEPGRWIDERRDAFTADPGGERASRFTSASNNGRVVLWQTAIDAGTAHPVRGVGAANWEAEYYATRSSDAGFVRQPHSLALEWLAERGFTGLLLVLVAVGAVIARFVAARRSPYLPERAQTMLVAAAACLAAWLAHAQVDWTWQLVGVSFLPVLCLGVVLGSPWEGRGSDPVPWPARVPIAVLLLAAIIATSLPTLAFRYMDLADQSDDADAASAHLQRAERLFPASADVAQRRATLAAQRGDERDALTFAEEAISRDPDHYARYEDAARLQRQFDHVAAAERLESRSAELNPNRRP